MEIPEWKKRSFLFFLEAQEGGRPGFPVREFWGFQNDRENGGRKRGRGGRDGRWKGGRGETVPGILSGSALAGCTFAPNVSVRLVLVTPCLCSCLSRQSTSQPSACARSHGEIQGAHVAVVSPWGLSNKIHGWNGPCLPLPRGRPGPIPAEENSHIHCCP